MSEFTKQLEDATDDFFEEYLESQRPAEQGGEDPVVANPVDTWQMYADARREYARKQFPNGATKKFGLAAESVREGLKTAYSVAKANADNAAKRGDKMRASIWRQQYMEDKFLPAVDAMVLLGSADELLNAKEVLAAFDDLTLLDGNLSGKGYTESIVRSLYDDELGQKGSRSDAVVREGVRKVEALANSGNVRLAVKTAEKLIAKIEAGENSAEDSDYVLLQKVAMRGH